MPILKNKVTGESYHVSEDEWKILKHIPAYKRAFEVQEAQEPEEVSRLKSSFKNSGVEQR